MRFGYNGIRTTGLRVTLFNSIHINTFVNLFLFSLSRVFFAMTQCDICILLNKSRNFDILRPYISRIQCPTNLLFVGYEGLKPLLTESQFRFEFHQQNLKLFSKYEDISLTKTSFQVGVKIESVENLTKNQNFVK